jgi:DNA-binding GntR family transcriptional regulator
MKILKDEGLIRAKRGHGLMVVPPSERGQPPRRA